jgi:uncharacterized DUF497 family protein
MGQFKFFKWLAFWYEQEDQFIFDWDEGNLTKSKVKHGVDFDEVESVFNIKSGVVLGKQVSPPVQELRICVVGPAFTGRVLSVVFTLRDGRVRPISSRIANKKERDLYEEIRKET